MIIQIVFFAVLIICDRITKNLAVTYLKGQDAVSVIKDVVELRYLENSGAAFGIFQNMQLMFYIITFIILVVIVILWISNNNNLKKYCKLPLKSSETEDPESNKTLYFQIKTYRNIIFLNYLIVTLAAGAIGNLIDRLSQKYVVDFIYFKIIDFPIFNFADICVTVTAVLLIIFFIFVYKEDPGFNIFGKKNK